MAWRARDRRGAQAGGLYRPYQRAGRDDRFLGNRRGGPANAPLVTGPVELSNTRLTGFNLGSKLSAISAFTGSRSTGDTTEVQTLRLTLDSSPAGVRTDNLYAQLPALGTVTGNGAVSAAGALNYRLFIKLNTTAGSTAPAVSKSSRAC